VLTVELSGSQNSSWSRRHASEKEGKKLYWFSEPVKREDPSILAFASAMYRSRYTYRARLKPDRSRVVCWLP